MPKFELEIGEQKLVVELRNLAERANGEVMLKYGDTQVLTTAVMSEKELEGLGFFPLTVNYEERYYAAGKILGSRYIKREGKPSDNAVLISRMIDRSIRPFFDQDLKREIQVIITCLSWDEENDPDVLGILSASLALSLSNICWQGPVGVVRIGRKNDKLILNPTYKDREEGDFDIVLVGKKEGEAILISMAEAQAREVEEDLILSALKVALPQIKKLIDFQEEIVKKAGKEKIVIEKEKEGAWEEKAKEFLKGKIEKILFAKEKREAKDEGFEEAGQLNELKKEFIEQIEKSFSGKTALAKEFFEKEVKTTVQEKAVFEAQRVDGRALEEMREISCEVGIIPRAHGSGLFCRGITKSLSILTLGGPGEQQLIEGMEIVAKKRFLHHYNFPPYCVGEVARLTAPSRREIGHGILVEKALFPLIPEFKEFPYTIRVVSEILSSNGSTSMASVCSSCLALMDAGVPINRPVAGIAIGLMRQGKNYKLLADIQGPEDFYGDMDFKVAGSRKGITALQMDVKDAGIEEKLFQEALLLAKKVRLQILDMMEKTLKNPRHELSSFAPRVYVLEILPEKIGELIGPRGSNIKGIIEETGAEIDIEPLGNVYITSSNESAAKRAFALVKNFTREIKVGEVFLGKVKKILPKGALLELNAGQTGLLPSSQLPGGIRVGDKISVGVASIDEMGRINLASRKASSNFKKYDGRR